MNVSDLILPVIIGGILFYGIVKNVDIYAVFVEGAAEGARTALNIFPYILAIIFAINLFVQSGAERFMVRMLMPLTSAVGFPPELLSLAIVKPLSGGGSLGVFQTIIQTYGPDSYIGRSASILMGSSETIFYTVAVYFGAVGIKNIRHTVKVGLLVYGMSIFVSLAVCSLMM